jgi:hypothetical protein
VLAIVSVLISLTLIGVMQARELSQRVACQNNLHQIGIALTHFVETQEAFPLLSGNRGPKRGSKHTPFVALLPELDAGALQEVPTSGSGSIDELPPIFYRCPAGNDFLGYRFCLGKGIRTRSDQDGILRYKFNDVIRPSDVSDGLSHTVALGERLSGKGKVGGENQRRPFAIVVMPKQAQDDVFVDRCANQTRPYNFVEDPGIRWRGHQPVDLGYNHYFPPNCESWDCQAGFSHQLLTARSSHSAGVQAMHADGSVRWIASNVDIELWRALATIAGAETTAPVD